MSRLRLRGLVARPFWSRRGTQINTVILMLTLAMVVIVLASCGSAATAQAKPVIPSPTPTLAPTATPTPPPTPTPTPRPTPTPQPTSAPTVAPPPAPAILDVRPSSMSIVGHLDCQRNGAYICFARVLSSSSNQSNLPWFAFTNVPGHIVFSPVSGVLAPGTSVLITITVPFNDCTPGLFFFRGPINTHTITWAC